MKKKSSAMQFAETISEGRLHDSVAELLDWVLLPPAFYTTFPAGYGKLSMVMAARLKRRGMMPGMPDIFVFDDAPYRIGNTTYPRTKVVGIELKVPGRGSLSSNQRAAHAKLQGVGIRVYVCRSTEDVIQALKKAGIPIRYYEKGVTGDEIDEQASYGGCAPAFGPGGV